MLGLKNSLTYKVGPHYPTNCRMFAIETAACLGLSLDLLLLPIKQEVHMSHEITMGFFAAVTTRGITFAMIGAN